MRVGWLGERERIVKRGQDDSGSRDIGVRLINSISENDFGVLYLAFNIVQMNSLSSNIFYH